ncbi:MAG: SWIM zinc finger family protein [Deltaproteobacteria bacterium]|nr:SWIM zinc finger family protein [Deltaproteobacteria bacterium]
MSAKEMQRRNERAQQLRVLEVEEGSYFLESGDGKIAYKAVVNDDREMCTCLDYQRNIQNDPHFRCKHLLAILNCAPEGAAEKKAFLKKRQPRLDERFVRNIEGKDFVLYAGLLDLAHQKGLVSLETEILQFPAKENNYMAIVKAYAESKVGESFADVGDADPFNCNAKVAKHLLRMASTRAKARCLRDYTNIGMTCLEELGDLHEVLEEAPKAMPPALRSVGRKGKNVNSGNNGEPEGDEAGAVPTLQRLGKTDPKTRTRKTKEPAAEPQASPPMSEDQKRAIYNLSRRRGISVEELKKLARDAYSVELEALTAADASSFIRTLQQSA